MGGREGGRELGREGGTKREKKREGGTEGGRERVVGTEGGRCTLLTFVRIFQGQFRSTLRCLTCKHRSVNFEAFMYLSVPLPPGNSHCSLQVSHTHPPTHTHTHTTHTHIHCMVLASGSEPTYSLTVGLRAITTIDYYISRTSLAHATSL